MVSPPSRHQARAARPTKRTAPRCFRVCRATEAPTSRAAAAAAKVSPLKILRIGGEVIFRVPHVCEKQLFL